MFISSVNVQDLLSNKNNLNQEMRVLAGDLAGLETISLGNVRYCANCKNGRYYESKIQFS